jgi:hypothetical protein
MLSDYHCGNFDYFNNKPIWRYCHVRVCDSRRGFGLDIGFIDHLYTQLVSTSNYTAIADLSTLQITTADAKSFPDCCVFTSRSLVTTSNSGDSSASALKFSLNSDSLPIDSLLHRFPWTCAGNAVHSRMLTVYAGTCLTSRSLAAAVYSCLLRICSLVTDVVPLFRGRCLETNVVSEPFASNSCFSGPTVLALTKYVTIYICVCVYVRVLPQYIPN